MTDMKKLFISKLLYVLLICCIVAYLLVFAFINIQGFDDFCNSDVYADSQTAKRMWEQKTLFPEDWGFANQYYVIATPVLAALFYGLTGSINVSMVMATEIMTILILLSFVWLLRAFTKDFLQQLTACLLLIASAIAPYGPYSINSMLFYMQASFYACYMITMFVVFGDYVRAVKGQEAGLLYLMFALLLCFATGMHSLRQTVVTILPIVACEFYFLIQRLCRHEKMWNKSIVIRWGRVASYGLANMAGVVMIDQMDIPISPIYGEMRLLHPEEWLGKIVPIKTAFLEITSMDYLATDDYSSALAIVILFMVAIVATAAVLWILRFRQEEADEKLCWLLCVIGIAGVFLSTVVLTITLRGIYVFMWFPLVAFSGMMVLKKLPDLMKKGAVLVICVISMAGLFYCYFPYVQILRTGEKPAQYELAKWAVENNYEYVYGEYWGTAPAIAVCSDGKLDAGCWHTPENVFMVEMANTPQDIYGEEENAKAIYVFTCEDEEYGLRVAQERGIEMTKVAQFGEYCAYTSPMPLMKKW